MTARAIKKKQKGVNDRMIKKICIFILCLAVTVTFMPSSAFAAGTTSSYDDAVKEQEIIANISEVIEKIPEPADLAAWGTGKLLKTMFGVNDNAQSEQIMAKLDEILTNQKIIKDKLNQIDERVVKKEIIDDLNLYFVLDNAKTIDTYHDAIERIDKEKKSQDQKSADMVEELAKTIPGSPVVTDSLTEIDKLPFQMSDFFITGVKVTYQNSNDNIFGLYHMWCKYQYHWEHQAYEDWITFRDYVYLQYINAASIDRMSLVARIQILESENKIHPTLDARLDQLKKQIGQVSSIYNSTDEWSGLVKKRPDNVRYYWHPGNEKLLYTKAHQQIVPQEESGCGLKWHSDRLKGFHGNGHVPNMPEPTYSFWRPFTSYTREASDGGGLVKCPTVEWYQQVYTEYGSGTSLYTIFFDQNEGNFSKPAGCDGNWKYVADPATGHEMKYCFCLFHEDQITTPVVRSDSSEVLDGRNGKGTDIYWYHDYKTEISPGIVQKGFPYVGLGVVDGYLVNENGQLNSNRTLYTTAPNEKVALKAKATKKGFKLSWTKCEKATKYVVYQKKVGAKKFKKIKTLKPTKKKARNSLTIKKSKLKKKKGYTYYVRALGKANGKKFKLKSWNVVVYPTNGKYTNVKSLAFKKGTKSALTIKKGKTKKLGIKVKKVKKSKKLPKSVKKLRFISADKKIATVSKKGVIKAKKAGTCYVYAVGSNGVSKKIKVTVK